MERVIVTVKSSDCSHQHDIEIPTNLQANVLVNRIIELTRPIDSCFIQSNNNYQIYIEYQNRTLEEDETLGEAGVWDGSIIKLKIRGPVR